MAPCQRSELKKSHTSTPPLMIAILIRKGEYYKNILGYNDEIPLKEVFVHVHS